MKVTITAVKSIFLCIVSVGVSGSLMAAESPQPPAIGETFACTYKDGKGLSDKMKARDYLVAQLDKAGLTKVPAYHMTQINGMAPVDTVWMDVHPNLAAYGANTDEFYASGIGPGVNARFAAVEDCTTGLSALEVIHQEPDEGEENDGPSLVVTLACQYKHGKGNQQMDDLTGHMGMVMANMGDDAPGFSYLRTPITGNQNFPDVFFSSVFDDMSHWTRYVGQLFNTDAGQTMRNHMDMVVDCSISMWRSEQVVAPDEE